MRKTHAMCFIMIASLALAIKVGPASAAYPERPIEFIIPFGAGGGADIEGRLLAKEMSKILGVPFVPINKVGAGGAVTYTYVKNAKPDGYTIAWSSTSILTTTNIGNVPFDHSALEHLGRVEVQPIPLAVRADAKWKTFNDFVADCRKNPGKYKVANASIGSATHLVAVALMSAAKCDAIHLPVGIKRRNAALLSGEAHAMTAPLTGAIRLAKARKIRLLVIPSGKREPAIPDVPTAKELGYEADVEFFRGLSVPKGTPQAIVKKLADAMIQAARSPAFMKLANKMGFRVDPIGPDEFAGYVDKHDEIVRTHMKRAGIYQSKRKK